MYRNVRTIIYQIQIFNKYVYKCIQKLNKDHYAYHCMKYINHT